MKYVGELYFKDDDDVIKVGSFIVRSDVEVAFSVITTWEGGNWSKSGIASFDGKNYVSDLGPSTLVETGEVGPNCEVTFSKVDSDGRFLCIEGSWRERGKTFSFEGDLEQQS